MSVYGRESLRLPCPRHPLTMKLPLKSHGRTAITETLQGIHPYGGFQKHPLARMLLLVRGRGVLTDWLWYRDLTHEQRVLYEELLQTDTEIHLSAVDCKQLVKGLMRLGIRTPWQLRDWFDALAEADNDYE